MSIKSPVQLKFSSGSDEGWPVAYKTQYPSSAGRRKVEKVRQMMANGDSQFSSSTFWNTKSPDQRSAILMISQADGTMTSATTEGIRKRARRKWKVFFLFFSLSHLSCFLSFFRAHSIKESSEKANIAWPAEIATGKL